MRSYEVSDEAKAIIRKSEEDKAIMQQTFDKACASVIAQGCKSMIGIEDHLICTSDACAYRGAEGRKCAIGHLLTDEQIEHYRIEEGDPVGNFSELLINELLPGVAGKKAEDFLVSLQGAHDTCKDNDFETSFKIHANKVATKFGLRELV